MWVGGGGVVRLVSFRKEDVSVLCIAFLGVARLVVLCNSLCIIFSVGETTFSQKKQLNS